MPTKQADNVVDFDISKYFGDLNKYVADFKAPGFDFDALAASQRRNYEAVVAANQLAVDAMQAVLKRQAEILRHSVEEMTVASRALSAPGSAPEKAAKQTEMTKDAFERAVTNARELSEMIAKSNTEALDLLNKRFVQSLDEMRDMLLKLNKA